MGAELAYRLYEKKHQVTVIDEMDESFNNLHPSFQGRTIRGEALSQDVLRRAGIEQANGFAAVTNFDAVNAVVAYVARSVYRVANVVSRNYNARYQILHEALGVQMVSSTLWGAQRFEQLLYSADVRPNFSIGHGEVEVYEITVPTAWRGRELQTVKLPEQCLLVALTRGGKAMLPAPKVLLGASDTLHISATIEGIKELRKLVVRSKE